VAITGDHRKHATRLLSAAVEVRAGRRRAGRRRDAVRSALAVLWEASDGVCSKRLRPLIPGLLPALGRHRKLEVDPATRSAPLEGQPCHHRPPAVRDADRGATLQDHALRNF
jgi:hypothetical protein